jgi:hypothetical protein
VSTPDQAGEVRSLARQAGISPRVSAVRPGAAQIAELTGPPAPHVEPAPASVPQSHGQSGGGRRRRGGSGDTAGRSHTQGPARTRAELAARAGSHSASSFSTRARRGR